jgi:hypothetical protein
MHTGELLLVVTSGRLRAAVGDVRGRPSRIDKGGRGQWRPEEAKSGRARATASGAGRVAHWRWRMAKGGGPGIGGGGAGYG